MELSVVVPVYNEEKSVGTLISTVQKHLSDIDYELILVNDRSNDSTLENCLEEKNDRLIIISLDKNYGQSTAIKAGIDSASGEYIAIIDGDMQNDPADLPELYQLITAGQTDMIQGYRKNRRDSLSKMIPSVVANAGIRLIFRSKLHDVGCSTKIFKRQIISSLIYFNGFHRYLALIAGLKGFKVTEKVVRHYPRLNGKSKYGMERFWPVCRDLILLTINPEWLQQAINYKITKVY